MKLSGEEVRPFIEFAAEHTSDSMLCLDTEGHILWVNPAASRTLGIPSDQLTEKSISDIASDMNEALWRELWKEIRARGSFSFEFQLGVGAHRVQVEMSIHHLRPAQRELACIFFRDIEERQRLQQLQQEFVSTASHELRTPMTVIREGVAQVLEGLRGEINESQQRALTMVLGSIDRLGRIMDELLDISKMEAGKITLRHERLDLTFLVREVVSVFQSKADERGLSLTVTAPADSVWIYADRDRLSQVLSNVLSNAFKFTEKGQIQIGLTVRSSNVECRVSDTGVGIASEDLERIFHKFEQGAAAVTGERGSGLGLSISKGIVDLHRGKIWAESAGVGKGTAIVFTLPVQSGAAFFRSQLEPLLRDVARRSGNLTLIVFQLESGNGAMLESVIRQCTGRMTDLLVQTPSTLYLAIPGMVRREGERVLERIVAAFAPDRVRSQVRGFPEDGQEDELYLELLREERR